MTASFSGVSSGQATPRTAQPAASSRGRGAMQVIEDSCFEQVGGRCKLKCDPPVSLLKATLWQRPKSSALEQKGTRASQEKQEIGEDSLEVLRSSHGFACLGVTKFDQDSSKQIVWKDKL